MSIPLIAREERVGLLFVASTTLTGFDDAQANIVAALAGQTMIAYDNALLFSRVEQLATTDPLCGISNRRHFFELAGHQVRVAARGDRPLAGVMLDIDHFKRINDTYGHAVGDDVIRAVANRLTENLRGIDILGRYGGEEFAVVLPDVADDVLTIAERIRATVAATPVDAAVGPVPVTVSVGVGVAILAGGEDDLDALLARADSALYRAKQNGRNQVVLA
jgi:eukaryotic-like serine/threonine-protein kinase